MGRIQRPLRASAEAPWDEVVRELKALVEAVGA